MNNTNEATKSTDKGVHTFITSPVGKGDLYGWKELDEKGGIVTESAQSFASEADAEKAMRTLAPQSAIIEVRLLRNINKDANTNVNLVQPVSPITDGYGANPVPRGIQDLIPKDTEKAKEPHENVAKMVGVNAAQAPLIEKAKADKAEADRVAAIDAAKATQETARRAALTPEQRAAEDKVKADKALADAKVADAKAVTDNKTPVAA